MTIWKFPLTPAGDQVIEIPEVNRPLTVAVQGVTPCLWALVDPGSRLIKIRIRTFGTAEEGVTSFMDYIGTYYQGDGLAWHVFTAGRV